MTLGGSHLGKQTLHGARCKSFDRWPSPRNSNILPIARYKILDRVSPLLNLCNHQSLNPKPLDRVSPSLKLGKTPFIQWVVLMSIMGSIGFICWLGTVSANVMHPEP